MTIVFPQRLTSLILSQTNFRTPHEPKFLRFANEPRSKTANQRVNLGGASTAPPIPPGLLVSDGIFFCCLLYCFELVSFVLDKICAHKGGCAVIASCGSAPRIITSSACGRYEGRITSLLGCLFFWHMGWMIVWVLHNTCTA
ncbi:hypothetical protein HDV64DRAFT_237937 [Trichoderma sp. TUCIM 5745]